MSETAATEIAKYYDDGVEGCLRDYVRGNRRIRQAEAFFLSALNRSRPRRVLDVGCGIGSSAYRLCQRSDGVQVVAVDISERRIAVARDLFQHPNLSFKVSAMDAPLGEGAFDAVVMMDVYEHIPRTRVKAFHHEVANLLTPDGLVLMTMPSPLHQARLAAERPDALQIVDETITAREIVQFADDIGAMVTQFRFQDVWMTNDYIHAALERAPSHQRLLYRRTVADRVIQKVPLFIQDVSERMRRRRRAETVYSRLGVRID